MAKKKVVDCFIFYNEIDLLQYRLNLLYRGGDGVIIRNAMDAFFKKEEGNYVVVHLGYQLAVQKKLAC